MLLKSRNELAFQKFIAEFEILTNKSLPSSFILEHSTQGFQKFSKKSRKASIVCLLVGQNALASCDYTKALNAFTSAIRLVPTPSELAAYCYFARSVALQKIKNFDEALKDLERSVALPLTEAQKTILLTQMNIIQSLNRHIICLEVKEKSNFEMNLSYGECKSMKGVSNAIALRYSKELGRHYIATQDIKENDVLMIQKPYFVHKAIEWLEDEKGTRLWLCENCLNKTLTPVPCNSCALRLYCSDDCRSKDFKRCHNYECKIVQLGISLKSLTLFFLRSLLILTENGKKFFEVLRISSIIEKKATISSGFKNGKLDGSNVEAVLSLIQSTIDENISQILVHNVGTVTYMLKTYTNYLKTEKYVHHLDRFFLALSDTLLKNIFLLQDWNCNLGTIVGVGFYPVLSYVKTSNTNNTLVYNEKHGVMRLIAIKDIKTGDQIFVSSNFYDTMEIKFNRR